MSNIILTNISRIRKGAPFGNYHTDDMGMKHLSNICLILFIKVRSIKIVQLLRSRLLKHKKHSKLFAKQFADTAKETAI